MERQKDMSASDHRKTLSRLAENARRDKEKVDTGYSEYQEEIRREKQGEHRKRLTAEYVTRLRNLRETIQGDLASEKKKIRQVKYPLATSPLEGKKLLGEMQILNASLIGERYPVDAVEEAWGAGRIDFVSAVSDRASRSGEPKSEEEVLARHKFFAGVRKLYGDDLEKPETEARELEGVLGTVEIFEEKVGRDFDVRFPFTPGAVEGVDYPPSPSLGPV